MLPFLHRCFVFRRFVADWRIHDVFGPGREEIGSATRLQLGIQGVPKSRWIFHHGKFMGNSSPEIWFVTVFSVRDFLTSVTFFLTKPGRLQARGEGENCHNTVTVVFHMSRPVTTCLQRKITTPIITERLDDLQMTCMLKMLGVICLTFSFVINCDQWYTHRQNSHFLEWFNMNLKLQFCHLDVEDLKVLEESEKMSKASDLLFSRMLSGCYHLFKLFLHKTRRLDENTEAERAVKIKEVQKEIQVQNVTTSYEISEIVFFTTEPRSSVESKASFHGVQFETKNWCHLNFKRWVSSRMPKQKQQN